MNTEYPIGGPMSGDTYCDQNHDPFYYEVMEAHSRTELRNSCAEKLEKAGRIREAIRLYEENLVDCASDLHSYERLRILHMKLKQYDEAIRVCRSYIRWVDRQLRYNISHSYDVKQMRDQFVEWIGELEELKVQSRPMRRLMGLIRETLNRWPPIGTQPPS